VRLSLYATMRTLCDVTLACATCTMGSTQVNAAQITRLLQCELGVYVLHLGALARDGRSFVHVPCGFLTGSGASYVPAFLGSAACAQWLSRLVGDVYDVIAQRSMRAAVLRACMVCKMALDVVGELAGPADGAPACEPTPHFALVLNGCRAGDDVVRARLVWTCGSAECAAHMDTNASLRAQRRAEASLRDGRRSNTTTYRNGWCVGVPISVRLYAPLHEFTQVVVHTSLDGAFREQCDTFPDDVLMAVPNAVAVPHHATQRAPPPASLCVSYERWPALWDVVATAHEV